MPAASYTLTHRALLAILIFAVPLTGCAAMSALQQRGQDQGDTWIQNPTDEEDQSELPEQSRGVELNPRIRTVELNASPELETETVSGAAVLASTLREEGEDWLGTRYRYGGTTRRGIDCSSFVQQLMRGALDIELPRTTATQQHRGEAVSRDELLPGDLVFFRRRGIRHVGVYLGEGEFIHASSGRGVIVSNLTEGYYRRHFWKARRVVDNPEDFLEDEFFVLPLQPADILRPGSRRATDRAPEQGEARSGNPRSSW